MSLAALKKKSATSVERLRETLQKPNQKGSFNDPNEWKPALDPETGTGYAVIRFMPEPEGEDFVRAEYFEHSFTGPTGKKYYARSLTSIGQKDPVGELNSRLWNSGVESDKEVARKQKRKARYVSNIRVVDDELHPENNGKVFKFRYGEKIWQKIEAKISPEHKRETPINPFDFWAGANFVLKIKVVKTGNDNFWNYDDSYFEQPSAVEGGDEAKLAEIYKSLHSLKEINDPKHYKSYDELQKRLLEVIGPTAGSGVPTVVGTTTGALSAAITPTPTTPVVVKPAVEHVAVSNQAPVTAGTPIAAPTVTVAPAAPADEEDDEAYFAKLMTE